MSHEASFCIGSIGTGVLPSGSTPHMARHSLPSMLGSQAKPPRPKSSLTSTSTTTLSAAGSGSRAASPYSSTGSYTCIGPTAYDVYRASVPSSTLQPRTLSRRPADHPAVSSTTSAYPHLTTALPMRKETSPSPSCQVSLSGGGGTRAVDTAPLLSGGGARRVADVSPATRCSVVQGASPAVARGRMMATAPVRSSSARQLVVSTRASTGTRVMTPPPRLSSNVVHVGALQAPVTQASTGWMPSSGTVPILSRGRSLSPENALGSPKVEPRMSPGQASRQVHVPRLRSPKSWEKRYGNNTFPPSTRTNDEDQDWVDDDFISHRRSSPRTPEQKDTNRWEQAPSEPERSPEERIPETLPEVINCRDYQDDMHERQSRMQDLEKNIDEKMEMWAKQQQVVEDIRSYETAELRHEMARLKETSIEEISKLRSEVQRLKQTQKLCTEAEMERSQQQQRVGKSVFPKSTKSPSSGRAPAAESTPLPLSNEASEVARLQAELEVKEESAFAARQQIALLQQEVDELRLLKKITAYAQDTESGKDRRAP